MSDNYIRVTNPRGRDLYLFCTRDTFHSTVLAARDIAAQINGDIWCWEPVGCQPIPDVGVIGICPPMGVALGTDRDAVRTVWAERG